MDIHAAPYKVRQLMPVKHTVESCVAVCGIGVPAAFRHAEHFRKQVKLHPFGAAHCLAPQLSLHTDNLAARLCGRYYRGIGIERVELVGKHCPRQSAFVGMTAVRLVKVIALCCRQHHRQPELLCLYGRQHCLSLAGPGNPQVDKSDIRSDTLCYLLVFAERHFLPACHLESAFLKSLAEPFCPVHMQVSLARHIMLFHKPDSRRRTAPGSVRHFIASDVYGFERHTGFLVHGYDFVKNLFHELIGTGQRGVDNIVAEILGRTVF